NPQTPSSTVSTSLKNVYTPIRYTESNYGVHFPVSLLVVEGEAKTFPISHLPSHLPQTLSPSVRASFKSVYTPVRCAESNSTIRFAIGPLVVEISMKLWCSLLSSLNME